MRTAREMSAAPQSLGIKPEAPAAFAAPGEIRPAPLISSTLVVGDRSRSCWLISGPDSSPMNRSTSATSGL